MGSRKVQAKPEAKAITTTLGELITAHPALLRVAAQDSMTAKVRYAVVKLAQLVAAEVKHFEGERRKLFDELGVERPDAPALRDIPAHRVKEFQARLEEVAAVAVTIPWSPLKSSEIPKALAGDLIELGPLCELVEPEET